MTHSALPETRRSASARALRRASALLFAALGGLVGCGTILGIEPGVFTGDADSGGDFEAGALDTSSPDAPAGDTSVADGNGSGDLDAEAGPPWDASDAPSRDLDAEAGPPRDASEAGSGDLDGEAGLPRDASPDVGLTLALGQFHACALLPDGAVDCWGDNSSGQLGVGDAAVDGDLPTRVPGLGPVIALSAGPDAQHQCAALEDGAVECWGDNDEGQVLGYQTAGDVLGVPTVVQGLPGPVSALAAGPHHTCAILAERPEVWCWGDWSDSVVPPTRIPTAGSSVTSLSAGFSTCAVTSLGAGCWGVNDWYSLGSPDASAGSNGEVIQPQGLSDAVQIAMGNVHGCAVASGHVLCWGGDASGETGENPVAADGGSVDISVPTQVPGLNDDFVEVAAEIYDSCARRAGGDVWCWGMLNGFPPAVVPQLSSLGPATRIFGGGDFACALVGGAAYCWGYDDHGQLGDGEIVPNGKLGVTKVQL